MKKLLLLMFLSVLFASCVTTTPTPTYELAFTPNCTADSFPMDWWQQQSVAGECGLASACMYLRAMANDGHVDMWDLKNACDYNYSDGLNATQTIATMNKYMNFYWIKTSWPYSLFNGKIRTVKADSSDNVLVTAFTALSKGLDQYKSGVMMGFTNFPGAQYVNNGHFIFAYGCQRNTKSKLDYTKAGMIYAINPQYAYGSFMGYQKMTPKQYESFWLDSAIYDNRL
jgi:hypothetical protein